MIYPKIAEIPSSREMIDVFGGYNHNLRIGSGEFYDMKNLTSSYYPVLSPRHPRGFYASPQHSIEISAIISKDSLCHIDGAYFYINGKPINMKLSSGGQKSLISMGAYVIIMPDRKWINTETEEWGEIDAKIITQGDVEFSLCDINGKAYNAVPSPTEPDNPEELSYWVDTSTSPNVLKQYSKDFATTWIEIPTTYVKIGYPNIGENFNVDDGINISKITVASLSGLNGSNIVWAKDTHYIIVTGIIESSTPLSESITIERTMPDMDFVIESGNRLWGCKYGPSSNGAINEIYASKLGDFKNWNCFMGISTDSYAVSLGSDGQFTGAITHLGYPIFFKENCMHKIYGNYPANYQVQTTDCRGVQKGCAKSLAIVNETLYYKSRSSVCAYDGSLPVEISTALGDVTYSDAVAGVLGNKYYISMKDAEGSYHLFVYDTKRGMWHREDDTQAVAFSTCRGNLYFIDHDDGAIKSVLATPQDELEKVKWEAVTGVIGTDSPDTKVISRLITRLKLEAGSRVAFFAEYDSSGEWEHLFTTSGISLKSFSIPIKPKRCDHLRIWIVGEGEAKIYSICKVIERGSDINGN